MNNSTCYCTNWEAKATDELKDALPTLDKMDFLTSPRVLKSHLPAYLLPPNLMDTCKVITANRRCGEIWIKIQKFQVIYVARNPKDAIVSFYYFHQMVKFFQFTGTLEEFAEYFITNKRKWTLISCKKWKLQTIFFLQLFGLLISLLFSMPGQIRIIPTCCSSSTKTWKR